jgi:hypothetical protein
MSRLWVTVSAVCASALAACASPDASSSPSAGSAAQTARSESAAAGAGARQDASSGALCSPGADPSAAAAQAALDALDTRRPVPLLPMMANHQKANMRDHLVAVQEIVAGIGANDFDAIEKASRRIGYSEQMNQMCSHMGAGAPGFTEQALAFHHTADEIGDAAHEHDMKKVLSALHDTMTACTSCHATFKQHVVQDASLADPSMGDE